MLYNYFQSEDSDAERDKKEKEKRIEELGMPK